MKLEAKIMGREFKPTWKQVKECFKKGSEEKRLEQYSKKEMKYTKNKTRAGTEFKTKKNIRHYVNDRTNG